MLPDLPKVIQLTGIKVQILVMPGNKMKLARLYFPEFSHSYFHFLGTFPSLFIMSSL